MTKINCTVVTVSETESADFSESIRHQTLLPMLNIQMALKALYHCANVAVIDAVVLKIWKYKL